jgi:FkbM family methyltransferase
MIGDRSPRTVLHALGGVQHYKALFKAFSVYDNPPTRLVDYLFARGAYPTEIRLRTPVGMVSPTLYSSHDLLTVNEIFCREDYTASADVKVVVDIGSNIGISVLYFMSRNNHSRCYAFEPLPENLEKLRNNLHNFSSRVDISPRAVADFSGTGRFGVEPTGRYCGLDLPLGSKIDVETVHINDVLENVFSKEGAIDILKVDTEGAEIRTITAIEGRFLRRIRHIYIEARPGYPLLPNYFKQAQYGSVCRLSKPSSQDPFPISIRKYRRVASTKLSGISSAFTSRD